MKKVLLCITNTIAPNVCGQSDYALRVATALTRDYGEVRFGLQIIPTGMATPPAGIRVAKWSEHLDQLIASGEPGDILLNYAPTVYSRWGYPWGLLRKLAAAKRTGRIRLFVHFHETWHGGKLRPHLAIKDRLVRATVVNLAKLADGTAVFTEAQYAKIASLQPAREVWRLPIGSAIVPGSPDEGVHSARVRSRWVVFGLSHTRLWTLKKYLTALKAFKASGVCTEVVAIGPADDAYAAEEKALAIEAFGEGFVQWRGALGGAQASGEFLSAGAALIGQNADSLSKSSSFAAMAAHAIPVICDLDRAVEDPPSRYFVPTEELRATPRFLEGADCDRRRLALHAWFSAHRSWEAVGRQFVRWMDQG